MASQLNLVKQLLLVVSPVVASSAIAIAPSQAATFSAYNAAVDITNLNQELQVDIAESSIKALAISESGAGSLTVEATTDLTFESDSSSANSFSVSLLEGQGLNYFGKVQSAIKLLGSFVVEQETFSFDFNALLNLETSVDHPQTESANAKGKISLLLYDTREQHLLDSFTILGRLRDEEARDSLKIRKSKNFELNSIQKQKDFEGSEKSAFAQVTGKFSRFFAKETYVSLVAVQHNAARVSSKTRVEVPESSNSVALLLFSALGLMALVKVHGTPKSLHDSTTLNESETN